MIGGILSEYNVIVNRNKNYFLLHQILPYYKFFFNVMMKSVPWKILGQKTVLVTWTKSRRGDFEIITIREGNYVRTN